MGFGGAALRFIDTFVYLIAFCCAGAILALYSYFLSAQSTRHVPIPVWQKAVEAISGIAVCYTIAATVLTCFLGGITFFAFLGIFLDILFAGGFIALAVLTRDGAGRCTGNVNTPLGDGPGYSHTGRGRNGMTADYNPTLRTACRMNTACFAASLLGALLFIFAAFFQFWLGRHHKREKRYGPSPANGYTSGRNKGWFRRNKRGVTTDNHHHKEAEAGTAVAAGALAAEHHHHHNQAHQAAVVDNRHSVETGHTGSKLDGQPTGTHVPVAGGFHTGPTGTSVNPYGYEGARTGTATNY